MIQRRKITAVLLFLRSRVPSKKTVLIIRSNAKLQCCILPLKLLLTLLKKKISFRKHYLHLNTYQQSKYPNISPLKKIILFQFLWILALSSWLKIWWRRQKWILLSRLINFCSISAIIVKKMSWTRYWINTKNSPKMMRFVWRVLLSWSMWPITRSMKNSIPVMTIL